MTYNGKVLYSYRYPIMHLILLITVAKFFKYYARTHQNDKNPGVLMKSYRSVRIEV